MKTKNIQTVEVNGKTFEVSSPIDYQTFAYAKSERRKIEVFNVEGYGIVGIHHKITKSGRVLTEVTVFGSRFFASQPANAGGYDKAATNVLNIFSQISGCSLMVSNSRHLEMIFGEGVKIELIYNTD